MVGGFGDVGSGHGNSAIVGGFGDVGSGHGNSATAGGLGEVGSGQGNSAICGTCAGVGLARVTLTTELAVTADLLGRALTENAPINPKNRTDVKQSFSIDNR